MALAPDLCGTVLDDRYELEALIGEGAFGRVYRGRDRRLHRAVAVKVIKPWWAEDPDWASGFTREARLLAAINDPGIVAIHDIGHGPEGPYYVSELVEGENLAVRLRAGAIGASEARSIALGLCRGLAAAHALRIIHRDVKPANVLLAEGPGGSDVVRVKVTDFGVARLGEATSGGHPDSIVAGTPRYMAPEQGRGGAVSPAADVYSAGAVLYEMLAGHPPFDGVSAVALALAHLSDPPPPLPNGVPADLRRVVARALAKDPGERYADGAAMAAALSSGAGEDPGTDQDPRVGQDPRAGQDPGATRVASRRGPRRLFDPAARRRSVAVFGLALGLLGGLITAAVLLGDHSATHRGTRVALAPPVEVPLLIGGDATAASARLHALHLRARVVTVPAPGIRPGTVTSQSPAPGATTPARSTVTLDVSEVPRWRTVTTFTAHSSPVVSIVGERWRILATVQSAHHCSFLVFCHSTSATVTVAGSRVPLRRVALGDGTAVPSVLSTGPGTYRVTVHPASGSTHWSIEVQDDY
jgi:hypothetical protein